MNDLAQETGDRILRHGVRGAAQRRKGGADSEPKTKSGRDRCEGHEQGKEAEQVIIQARRKIQKGLDQERARDGTRERLRLGHEFRNIGDRHHHQ